MLRATEAYFNLLLARRQCDVRSAGLRNLNASKSTMERLVQGKFDNAEKLLQYQSRIVEMENKLYNDETSLLEKTAQFEAGISATASGVLLAGVPLEPSPLDSTILIDSLAAAACSLRPDYRIAMENVHKAELNLTMKRSSTLPDLQLVSDYYSYGSDPGFGATFQKMFSDDHSWSVGAKFSMPLDRSYRMTQLRPAMIALEQARYNLESLRRKIMQEILTSYNKTQLIYKQYEAGEGSLGLVRGNLDEARKLHDGGFIPDEKLFEHQDNVREQELRQLSLRVQYTLSWYRFMKSRGMLAGAAGISPVSGGNPPATGIITK